MCVSSICLVVFKRERTESMQACLHWNKKTVVPFKVQVWPMSYFHFLSVCSQCGFMLGILVVLVWDVKSSTRTLQTRALLTSEWKRGASAGWTRTITFNGTSGSREPKCSDNGTARWSGSEDISAIRHFMYLWRAIKANCLDRELAPCLPTNKPSALDQPPIYYSQSAVMSRSKRQHSHGQG